MTTNLEQADGALAGQTNNNFKWLKKKQNWLK